MAEGTVDGTAMLDSEVADRTKEGGEAKVECKQPVVCPKQRLV